jgi:hypothetical protein
MFIYAANFAAKIYFIVVYTSTNIAKTVYCEAFTKPFYIYWPPLTKPNQEKSLPSFHILISLKFNLKSLVWISQFSYYVKSFCQVGEPCWRPILCLNNRGRILGRNWDKSPKSFPPCYSQSSLLTAFTSSPPPLSKSSLKLVCYVNIVHGNLKSDNSQN